MRGLTGLLRPFLRPYRRALCLGALLALCEVALGLAQPWPLRVIVDHVLIARVPDREELLLLCILALLVLTCAIAILDYWSTRLLASTGLQVGNDLRRNVFDHLQSLSLRFHGSQRVGDLTSRVTSDVERTQDLVVQTLSVLLPNLKLFGGSS